MQNEDNSHVFIRFSSPCVLLDNHPARAQHFFPAPIARLSEGREERAGRARA